MKKYKCIKKHYVPEVDVYDNYNGNNLEINIGTIYELDESGVTHLGGEIHLDSTEDSTWIEISNKTFRECFEEIGDSAE